MTGYLQSGWSKLFFSLFFFSLFIISFSLASASSGITQWNSVTEDASDSFSVDIHIDESNVVEFTVSSDLSYEWMWSVNGEEIKDTEGESSNLFLVFDEYGGYNVSVVGDREDETVQAYWNVTVSLVIGEENDIRELEELEDYILRISKRPERIVSMAPSCTEILFAVGAGDRVVGVTKYCNYPPEVEEKKEKGEIKVIGGYSTPSFEKIVDLKPDLIISAHGNPADVIYRLIELGYPVYAMHAKNIEEIFSHIKVSGAITNCDETASSLLNELRERLYGIEEKTELIEEEQRPRVFYNIGGLFTAGKDTFINEIIETAGGKNIAADKSGYFKMSLEELVDKNPQVILCDSGMGSISTAYEEIMSDDRLKIVDAVKNNWVYIIEGDTMDRPGPRVIDAVEKVYAVYSEFFTATEEEEEEEEGGYGDEEGDDSLSYAEEKTFIKAGEERMIELGDECLKNITIKAREDVEFAEIFVNVSKELKISQPPATVYRYLNLSANNLTGDIEWLKLNFSVNRSWIVTKGDNNTTAISLFCYDYNNGTWTELNTSEVGEGGNNVYYTVTSPSFGTFAICLPKLKSVQSRTPPPVVTETPSPMPTFVPVHTPIHTSTPTPKPFPTQIPKPSGFEVFLAVIGLLVVMYLFRKKQRF